MAFEVPGPELGSRGVLEATFRSRVRLGEWDFQMLGTAAQIGGARAGDRTVAGRS